MKMATRGGQSFAPYPQLQPAEPFPRDDADDVGQAFPGGDAALLHQDQAQQAGLGRAFFTVVRRSTLRRAAEEMRREEEERRERYVAGVTAAWQSRALVKAREIRDRLQGQ
jgi:hypothetical protein